LGVKKQYTVFLTKLHLGFRYLKRFARDDEGGFF
jgi:hypothetical protein